MHKHGRGLPVLLSSLALLTALDARSAGLGDGATSAVLGQPLNYSVPLRVDAGDALGPECINAEVTSGDRKLPVAMVRTALEPTAADSARVRVMTTIAMDEPVISVLLTVGCQTRVSRRFVLLADPPASGTGGLLAAQAAVPAVRTADYAAVPAAQRTDQPTAVFAAAVADAQPADAALAAPPPQPRRATAGGASADGRRAAQRRARESGSAVRPERARNSISTRSSSRTARAPTPSPAVAKSVTTVAAGPRLKLEPSAPQAEPANQVVEQALEAVAQAASAARAAASAASAADARIATLERTVEQLRGDAKASRDLAAQMRERVAQAEAPSRWLLPLLVGVVVLALLVAWLAWRLAELRRVQQRTWQQALAAQRGAGADVSPSRQATSPIPFVTSEIAPPPPLRPRAAPAWPPPAVSPVTEPPPDDSPPPSAMERTQPFDAHASGGQDGVPRDVSIEELIDLEQQAEFFVVLGQDDAATELLVEHLRSTGGGSPLPYLKLLEIYHRRGDREAYERTRGRFNDRFNAYAPDWDSGLQQGRTLEDYPGVIPRLQHVWPRPLDTMAELEALLFRKSRGDLFDLPAYREVLFLYSLARDLMDREAADTGSVDLLLPLADGGEFSATGSHPYFGPEHEPVFESAAQDAQTTGPVDLDLTVGEASLSIFDHFDGRPAPPQRKR